MGIGTDIIECPRIGKMIEHHGELFLRRIYTEREIRYCQARKHAIEHFAGRWAAKEAILKAMGTGRSHGIAWTNIEVRNGQGGRPQVHGLRRGPRDHDASVVSPTSWSRSRTAEPMPPPMRWHWAGRRHRPNRQLRLIRRDGIESQVNKLAKQTGPRLGFR